MVRKRPFDVVSGKGEVMAVVTFLIVIAILSLALPPIVRAVRPYVPRECETGAQVAGKIAFNVARGITLALCATWMAAKGFLAFLVGFF